MDLRRYTHVVALAEEGHFHRAAERVHLSQPAFSRSIQAAEADLGLTLFERGTEGIRCTPAGEFVVARLRPLVAAGEQLARDMEQLRDGSLGTLALGVGPFVATALLPPLLTELRQRYPKVGVRVVVRSPHFLLESLRAQELDVVVGDTRFASADPALQVQPLGRVRGALFVRAGHPLLGRDPLVMADLQPYGLAAGRLPADVQRLLLQRMGLTDPAQLPIAVDCDDMLALKAITRCSDYVLVATQPLVAQELAEGSLVRLLPGDMPPRHAELGLVSLRARSLSPVAAFAAGYLEQLMPAVEAAAEAPQP